VKIVIVDYGMGNVRSIVGALNYIGQEDVLVSNQFEDLNNADRLILPGVGNFSQAMRRIIDLELDKKLVDLVVGNNKSILGICLGMQLLGRASTEGELNFGLGIIDGRVERFEVEGLKVPHVGYNQVIFNEMSRLYKGLSTGPDFYFTHSFRMLSDSSIGASTCQYGGAFVASFELENVAGVQFHPELSQDNGLQLLRNFVELFEC